ncbi:MAG: hypothetical protein J0M24_04705 [Verrucomicrobia bacterium]|nr:hypothetical protein [Verrucomicrobiota bacterium]
MLDESTANGRELFQKLVVFKWTLLVTGRRRLCRDLATVAGRLARSPPQKWWAQQDLNL